ncbi:hypothetical protein ACFVQ0_19230 [Streptomyces sp. NPDC057900]|uniref:hypothetical protein n=1 Tax=Streptomyces sp. NPDC057900 TaxID=3346274 RepID=UPI0036E1AA96
MHTATLMTEHPSWHLAEDGSAHRAVRYDGAPWYVRWDGAGLTSLPLGGADRPPPPVRSTTPAGLPSTPAAGPLNARLRKLGTVVRLANPSLWDAVATAVLRQVVQAAQARKVHRNLSAAHGEHVATDAGPLALVPAPETVIGLSDERFREVGALFFAPKLRSAARAYLECHSHWLTLDGEQLAKELVTVDGIGPWTAAAATADFTGDLSHYPYGDLAVRTWARAAAPELELPRKEAEFSALWRSWAPERDTLHTLTLFTLTWGSHARRTPHGGPSPRP